VARMGGRRHLKPYAAPEFWPIPVKERPWTVKPSPGPHPTWRCVPLLVLVRDVLGYAQTAREARKIIASGAISVDGRVRRDYKYPVGVMDVLHVIPDDKYFRLVPDPTKFLKLVEISKEEARIKPVRIENKTTVKGGHIQLSLFDGRSVLIRVQDPRNPVEDKYETLGTLVITIPEQQILDYVPMQEGMYAVVFAGKNVGRRGRVGKIEVVPGRKRRLATVTISEDEGGLVQTKLDYVYVVGRDKPLITL